jgi:hypothetical protein
VTSQRDLGKAWVIQAGWVGTRDVRPSDGVSPTASLNSARNSQTAKQVIPTVAILGGCGPGNPYFNPNAFAAVTTPTFGNSGRDIIRGPGVFNVNASLFRSFSSRERVKAQFRADALGLTNTPQFSNASATVGSSSLSIASAAAGARQISIWPASEVLHG